MAVKLFMGIDNGGTMCKVGIFDLSGKEISTASQKLDLLSPASGRTERNMDYLWNVNAELIHKTIVGGSIDAELIKGIACTGHGKGLYLWGKNDRPACNGIVSTDTRAWNYVEKWKRDGVAENIFDKTFQSVLACQPVSLLAWLRDNNPGVYSNIKWIFEVKDYIRFKLTGEAFAELTDISGTNLLNLKTRVYDWELLSVFGIEEIMDALPPIKKSTDLCGTITKETAVLTGLVEGTPVAGGMFDINACAVAMDIMSSKNICVIAGTWGINEYISEAPVLDGSILMNSLYCLEDYYLIEESSPTSAGNLEWYIKTFLVEEQKQAHSEGFSIYQYCDKQAESISPDELGLVFLPYIYGSNYNPEAKACFIGMDSHHKRSHIIRAVFEGVVFSHMVHLEKLLASKETVGSIRLAGGAAKSKVWAQMFADITGLSVEIIETEELGSLGCAMTAAVASGVYPDLKTAAKTMVKVKKVFKPEPARFEIYRKKFEVFKKITASLDLLWGEI